MECSGEQLVDTCTVYSTVIVQTHATMKTQMGNWPDFSLTITFLKFVLQWLQWYLSAASAVLTRSSFYLIQLPAPPFIFNIEYMWETPVDLWGLKGILVILCEDTFCQMSELCLMHSEAHWTESGCLRDTTKLPLSPVSCPVSCSPCSVYAGQ